MTTESERDAFEKFASGDGSYFLSLVRGMNGDGDYVSDRAHWAWQAWQARADKESKEHSDMRAVCGGMKMEINELRAALDQQQGVPMERLIVLVETLSSARASSTSYSEGFMDGQNRAADILVELIAEFRKS